MKSDVCVCVHVCVCVCVHMCLKENKSFVYVLYCAFQIDSSWH